MEANELRIGNYVKGTFDVPAKIESDDFKRLEKDEHYCKPIPLTEEWLVKFDFIRNEYLNRWIFRDNEYFYFDMEFSLWFEGSYTCVQVEYVHQLQNLYFALTGNELEIKE